ncbi:MAG: HEAT repeat domain-containing protein [Arachnia sp.]
MSTRSQYADDLRARPPATWPDYLTRHSGLPGPRANLELIRAVVDVGDRRIFDDLISTDDEYLTCCGVAGLGAILAQAPGAEIEALLRRHATDARWRIRESVAMALQRLGDADLDRLAALARDWSRDPHPLVQRAAAAGICEPRLLTTPEMAAAAVAVCQIATDALAALPAGRRRDDDVRTLRQGLGYCWSVAVAADPAGLPAFLALTRSDDPDVGWINRENRKKKRLSALLASAE